MEKQINEIIHELNGLEVQPEFINEQFDWLVIRVNRLLSLMKEANVHSYFIGKFDYLPRFLSESKTGENIIVKENILKNKQSDLINALSDESYRKIYLRINPL